MLQCAPVGAALSCTELQGRHIPAPQFPQNTLVRAGFAQRVCEGGSCCVSAFLCVKVLGAVSSGHGVTSACTQPVW